MQKGEILQRVGADAEELFFLESGIIEVYTEFEEREFILERLFKGSIINYRTFFMMDKGSVNLRFGNASVLKALHKKKMDSLCEKYDQLNQIFNRYKLKIIQSGRSIPLDYVMALPKKITDQLIK